MYSLGLRRRPISSLRCVLDRPVVTAIDNELRVENGMGEGLTSSLLLPNLRHACKEPRRHESSELHCNYPETLRRVTLSEATYQRCRKREEQGKTALFSLHAGYVDNRIRLMIWQPDTGSLFSFLLSSLCQPHAPGPRALNIREVTHTHY